MISPTTYLNFYDLFFNEIVGDILLGIIVGLLIIWIASVRRNMSFQLALFFGLLWLMVAFIPNTGFIIIWVVVVLGIGTIFYYTIAKALGRGG